MGDTATHLVQIVDKPHQVIALEVLHTLPILLPIKDITKLIAKLG